MNDLLANIRDMRELEDDGYIVGDRKFTKGLAYWYYSDDGSTSITVMHTYSTPLYPSGHWHLVAVTINGAIDADYTHDVADSILKLGAINSQEKHTL